MPRLRCDQRVVSKAPLDGIRFSEDVWSKGAQEVESFPDLPLQLVNWLPLARSGGDQRDRRAGGDRRRWLRFRDREKRFYDLRIELSARVRHDFCESGVNRHRGTIGTVRSHCIISINNRKNTG